MAKIDDNWLKLRLRVADNFKKYREFCHTYMVCFDLCW